MFLKLLLVALTNTQKLLKYWDEWQTPLYLSSQIKCPNYSGLHLLTTNCLTSTQNKHIVLWALFSLERLLDHLPSHYDDHLD